MQIEAPQCRTKVRYVSFYAYLGAGSRKDVRYMNREQAELLAARIRTQLPHHLVAVVHSNADLPLYFVVIKHDVEAKNTLFIHNEAAWNFALVAWDVLGKCPTK